MGDEEEKKSLVERKRNRGVPVVPPTSVQVNDGGDYMAYLNNGGVATENNLPEPKATPMGVGGDGRYAKTDAKTDANTGTAAMNNLFGDSWALTPEQEQARLRRMHTSSMIGNLGNVMSAFANLYYAGKGAPSQKVPDAVVPDYMSFVDRVNQARRAALNDQYQRDKLQQQIDYQNESIALRKAREQRLNESARLAWRKQDWLEKYQAGVLDIKVEQNRINEEYKKGQISIQEWRAANDELKAQAAMLNAKTNSAREGRLSGGQTIEEADEYGNKKTKVVTPSRGGSSNKQGGAPPSRTGSQGKNTNNTPPSRRKK
jgi:hypothetical protein